MPFVQTAHTPQTVYLLCALCVLACLLMGLLIQHGASGACPDTPVVSTAGSILVTAAASKDVFEHLFAPLCNASHIHPLHCIAE
jgi:hypothetical protein